MAAPPRAQHPPNMSEITSGLFLGNLSAATDPAYLLQHRITHVLTLTSERVTIPEWAGIVHRQFRVRDDRRQNLLRFICDGVEFVEEAFTGMLPIMRVAEEQVRVFVHCRMGISRSGSVVVAYIMKHHQLPYEDALKLVREKRRIVNPNHAFVSQLLLLQDSRFDLSHLGPELLAQAIDNPYDPDEFPEETARRERRREEKRREKELEEATKRKLELEEEGRWVSILFASAKDRQSWEECMRVVRGDEMEVDEKEAEAGAEHAAAPGSQASPATPVPEAAESTPRTGTPPVGQDLSTPPTVVSTAPTTLPAVPDTEALDDTDMAMV